jgi:hypothetical protein
MDTSNNPRRTQRIAAISSKYWAKLEVSKFGQDWKAHLRGNLGNSPGQTEAGSRMLDFVETQVWEKSLLATPTLGPNGIVPLPCSCAFVVDSSAHEKNITDAW